MLYKALEKKIPPINPNPVLQALRTVGCPVLAVDTEVQKDSLDYRAGEGQNWDWNPELCCSLSCLLGGILLPGCRLLPRLFWLQKGEGAGALPHLGCGRISCDTILEVGGGGS